MLTNFSDYAADLAKIWDTKAMAEQLSLSGTVDHQDQGIRSTRPAEFV